MRITYSGLYTVYTADTETELLPYGRWGISNCSLWVVWFSLADGRIPLCLTSSRYSSLLIIQKVWSNFLLHTLLGGDFNCTPNPNIDKSPPKTTFSSKETKIDKKRKDLDLYDVWRVLHPLDKDYTFFSNPHQVFSRIDYFLSSRTVLGRILNCTIDTKFLSEHSPISVTISPPYPACRD